MFRGVTIQAGGWSSDNIAQRENYTATHTPLENNKGRPGLRQEFNFLFPFRGHPCAGTRLSPYLPAGPPFPFNSQFGWRSSLPSRAETKFGKFRFYPRSRGNRLSSRLKGRPPDEGFLENFYRLHVPSVHYRRRRRRTAILQTRINLIECARSIRTVWPLRMNWLNVVCSFLQKYFALVGKKNKTEETLYKQDSYFRYKDISRLVARRLYGR